jgi:hypothetical protein
MGNIKKWGYAFAILMGILIVIPQAGQATVVEFSEVILPQFTLLSGTTYYAPYGLSFSDSTYWIEDPRLPGAGTDRYGITNIMSDPNPVSVIFDAGASSVTFFWGILLTNDFYATAFDSNNNVLDTYAATGLSGTTYGYYTFSGAGTISKISFHDGLQAIMIGRLDFQPVPLPGGGLLLGSGLLGLAGWRRLRKS